MSNQNDKKSEPRYHNFVFTEEQEEEFREEIEEREKHAIKVNLKGFKKEVPVLIH